jgi:hypothetical protein
MTDLVTGRTTASPEPGGVPGLPDRCEGPAAPAPVRPDGVALTRLTALARLTPAQALELGAGVLDELAGQSNPGACERVPVDRVVVGVDGTVALAPAGDGSQDGGPSAAVPAGVPVAAVLAGVAAAARVRGRRADPAAELLLGHLDRAVAELPGAGVPAVAGQLREAAAGIDRAAVRAELAALVRAIGGVTAAATGPGSTGDRPGAVGAAPPRRASTGGTRIAARRIGAWLFSILVLTGIVLLEVAVLRDDIAGDVDLLLDAGRSGTETSAAPEPDGLPIVPPAPAVSGSVAAVDLRPLAPCAPDAVCTLRVLVRLVPGADPQVVTWTYRVVDRCSGVSDTAPGGSVTVPAGSDRAAAVGTVVLPAGTSVAVLAVTQAPAVAASPPVSVGSCPSDNQPR